MATSITYAMTVSGSEVLSNNVVAVANAASKTVTHTSFNTGATLTTGGSVPVTKVAYFSKALSTGSGTIDLTAVPGTDQTHDFSGLKVQVAKFENPSTNANSITVTFGASNGYLLAGSAWKAILAPGQAVMYFGNDATPDVGGSAKTIDISGTGSQALNVTLAAG